MVIVLSLPCLLFGDISSQIAGREPGFSSRPIGADADCPARLCANIRGLTFKQMNQKIKRQSKIVGGSSAQEIAKMLLMLLVEVLQKMVRFISFNN